MGGVGCFPEQFIHSHATLMVCLRANFLLTTLKYYLIHYDFPLLYRSRVFL